MINANTKNSITIEDSILSVNHLTPNGDKNLYEKLQCQNHIFVLIKIWKLKNNLKKKIIFIVLARYEEPNLIPKIILLHKGLDVENLFYTIK